MNSIHPILVDARGHRCPVPTLRLGRALQRATPGQVVRLLADDPMARIDVPHFAAGQDCQLLGVAEENGWLVFDVRKPDRGTSGGMERGRGSDMV